MLWDDGMFDRTAKIDGTPGSLKMLWDDGGIWTQVSGNGGSSDLVAGAAASPAHEHTSPVGAHASMFFCVGIQW